MSFGEKVREARDALGLTRDDLAGPLKVTGQAVYQWENDETWPTADKIPLLANLLKRPISWFYDQDDNLDGLDDAEREIVRMLRAAPASQRKRAGRALKAYLDES